MPSPKEIWEGAFYVLTITYLCIMNNQNFNPETAFTMTRLPDTPLYSMNEMSQGIDGQPFSIVLPRDGFITEEVNPLNVGWPAMASGSTMDIRGLMPAMVQELTLEEVVRFYSAEQPEYPRPLTDDQLRALRDAQTRRVTIQTGEAGVAMVNEAIGRFATQQEVDAIRQFSEDMRQSEAELMWNRGAPINHHQSASLTILDVSEPVAQASVTITEDMSPEQIYKLMMDED